MIWRTARSATFLLFCISYFFSTACADGDAPAWPIVKRYDQNHLAHIALPLGGIGTGTVSLGGRGDLRDWEVVNRPAKGFNPGSTFFAIWVKPAKGASITRAMASARLCGSSGSF